MTLYSLAKVLNARLLAEGLKPVPPQMMYNYKRNGILPVDEAGHITQADADTFVEWFVGKRLHKAAKA